MICLTLGAMASTTPEQLRDRTKEFALRIVRLFRALPRSPEAQVMGKQLLRSGTSVGANYRAVCRSRSRAEFVAKLGVVVEEADESAFLAGTFDRIRHVQKREVGKYGTGNCEMV